MAELGFKRNSSGSCFRRVLLGPSWMLLVWSLRGTCLAGLDSGDKQGTAVVVLVLEG